jgi:hypothetical protein
MRFRDILGWIAALSRVYDSRDLNKALFMSTRECYWPLARNLLDRLCNAF